MDITIEGFHSWMWRGLSFLLPFLLGGYAFQAYNSYMLYKLSKNTDSPWQVSMLSILFFLLFIGNTWTTLMVIPDKIRGKIKERYRLKSMSWAMNIRKQIRVRYTLKLLFLWFDTFILCIYLRTIGREGWENTNEWIAWRWQYGLWNGKDEIET